MAFKGITRTMFFNEKHEYIFLIMYTFNAVGQISTVQNVKIGSPLYAVNGKLLFAGDGANSGMYELWISDGTANGTHFLSDFSNISGQTGYMQQSDGAGWRHYDPVVLNNNLYFFAYTYYTNNTGNNYEGFDLWKSDGTLNGTADLMRFNDQWQGNNEFTAGTPSFCVFNNQLYFACGNNSSTGVNLWKTDGTTTTKVINIANNGLDGWGPAFLTVFNNAIYFVANDNISGPEVWKSDGTAAGTKLLKDIIPGQDGVFNTYSNYSGINPQFTVSGNYLYFFGYDNSNYDFLSVYRTDGTSNGTVRLDTTVLPQDQITSFYPYQAGVNNTYFFTGYPQNNSSTSSYLFKSNGIIPGPVEVTTNNNLKTAGIFTSFKNKLFFNGSAGNINSPQYGLCESDGSTAGTSLVYPFPYTSSTPEARDFTTIGNFLFFRESMFLGSTGTDNRIVQTDGTASGTTIYYGKSALSAPVALDGDIYFWGQDTINTPSTTSLQYGLYKFPDPNIVLPLTLVSFNATAKNNQQVQLNWQTASELNSKGFYIERSDNGLQFSSLAFVVGKGTSSQLNNYGFVDISPLEGTNYYRLKEVDNDGKVSFSAIRKINIAVDTKILITPNPVNGNTLIISHNLSIDKAVLRVTDMEGRVISVGLYKINRNTIRYNLGNLCAGVYLFSILNNGKVIMSQNFIKE